MIIRILLIILFAFLFFVIVLPIILNGLGIPIFSGSRDGISKGGSALGDAILVRSPDHGEHWQAPEFVRKEKEATPSGIFDIAFDPRDANALFAGTRSSGLWKSIDAGARWQKMNDRNRVLDARSDVYKIAISKARPEIMYLAVFQGNRGRVMKSEDNGASFREIYAVTQDRLGVFDVYTPPSSPDEVMIATGEGRLLESRDSGKSWRSVRRFGESVILLAVNPVISGERYAVTSLGSMSKTFDRGQNWTDLRNIADISQGASRVKIEHPYANWGLSFSETTPSFSFAIDPQNPTTLYLTQGEGLFSSVNGGFTWQKATTLITGNGIPLGGVAVHPAASGTLFITAGSDLYQSADRGTRWSVKMLGTQRPLKKIFVNPRHPEIILLTTGR